MPKDEEGQKWSCEPCIRGHRSSKCQHFDRLMTKVSNPGRPLSRCPHPKGKCACGKVYKMMVRIPKGSSCLCAPRYTLHPHLIEVNGQQYPAPVLSSQILSPNKIQKNGGKHQGSRILTPESVARALSTNGQYVLSGGSQPLFNTDQGTPSETGPPNQELAALSLNPSLNHQIEDLTLREKTESSCCSKKAETTSPGQYIKQKSCCGSYGNAMPVGGAAPSNSMANSHIKTEPDTDYHTPDIKPVTHSGLAQDRPPVIAQDGHLSGSQQLTFLGNDSNQSDGYFNLPDGLPHVQGFGMNPLLDHYVPRDEHGGSNGVPFSHLMGPGTAASPLTNGASFEVDPAHNCGCGDGCQCLGCASHPFNRTTMMHVQEMGHMIVHNAIENGSDLSGSRPQTSYNGLISPTFPVNPNDTSPSFSSHGPTLPPELTRNPSLNGNGHYNPGQMLPSDYYQLEYNVPLGDCTNQYGNCQCGVDCSCIGCLTHDGHSGIPLDTSLMVNGSEGPANEITAESSSGDMSSGNMTTYSHAGDFSFDPRALSSPF